MPEAKEVKNSQDTRLVRLLKLSNELTRIEFCKNLLNFSFLSFAGSYGLFSKEHLGVYYRMIREIQHMSRRLVQRKITPIKWQSNIEKKFNELGYLEVIRDIQLDSILQKLSAIRKGLYVFPLSKPIRIGPYQTLKHQLFVVKKGHSIVPHGHNYMTSGFFILRGDFHGRHYERIRDEGSHILIEPSIDQLFSAGGYSTISDERNNVHWFKADSDYGVILNIHVKNLRKGPKKPGRVYLNPLGENTQGGYIRAKRISRQKAYQLFG